jgi:hypothetical protein
MSDGMGHERNIEAMRDARHTMSSDRGGRADRRVSRGRRRRGSTVRRLIVVIVVLLCAVAVGALVLHFTGESGKGGGFAGTWKKGTPGTQLIIKEVGDGDYTVAVSLGTKASAATDGEKPVEGNGRESRVSKAKLEGGVLTATDMLGVQGLTVTFMLEDGGAVLVQTFPNGSVDRLERVE